MIDANVVRLNVTFSDFIFEYAYATKWVNLIFAF
jgi:hypothetical protein